MGIFNKKDEAPQDDEGQNDDLDKQVDEAEKAAMMAKVRRDAANGHPVAIMTLAHLETNPNFLDEMFDEDGNPRPGAAAEMLKASDPELIKAMIDKETGGDVPLDRIRELVSGLDEAAMRIAAERADGKSIDDQIAEMMAADYDVDGRLEDVLASDNMEGFLKSWAAFSEAMGADVKLIKVGADDSGDDDEIVITLPSHAAHMLCTAIEAGLLAVNSEVPLPFVKPNAKLRHVIQLHAQGDVRYFQQALYAASLLSGRIAMKKATKEFDESREDLDFDMADAIEAGADAKWRSAIDEGGCPVETPHDLTQYLKWIQGEKARLEQELAEATKEEA